ncbi:unnamed protein product [Rhizophagus irregularis]|nr:unnamed protein product [Rhizophagus irregularis]
MGKKRVRTRKNKKSDKTTNITEEVERIEHDLQDLTLGDTIERNENEPQIQANGIIELDENEDTIYPNNTNITEPDNVETDTRQEDNTIQLTNNRNSFIWNYLEKLSPLEKHKKRARCLVPVIGPEGYEQPCGHVMGTDDLWTSRSQAGYLGVTCSFVNNQFELHETILSIKYLKYQHTSDIIVDCLTQIIQEWNLNGKVFIITTDNGSNVVKAGKILKDHNNITRIPCTTHTLQLVVGKGLFPAERLVARAKRLISFFTTPKQTERLIEAQKKLRSIQQEDLSENDHYLRVILDIST